MPWLSGPIILQNINYYWCTLSLSGVTCLYSSSGTYDVENFSLSDFKQSLYQGILPEDFPNQISALQMILGLVGSGMCGITIIVLYFIVITFTRIPSRFPNEWTILTWFIKTLTLLGFLTSLASQLVMFNSLTFQTNVPLVLAEGPAYRINTLNTLIYFILIISFWYQDEDKLKEKKKNPLLLKNSKS